MIVNGAFLPRHPSQNKQVKQSIGFDFLSVVAVGIGVDTVRIPTCLLIVFLQCECVRQGLLPLAFDSV